MWPAFKDLLFTLHFLRAICDFPKMIFICNFLALKNIFSTHIAALLSDLLSSDLQILLYWTLTLRSLISGLFIPTNILGYASSSQHLSLNMLSGLLPSAGATFKISWRSLSSKKSVDVSIVSVTPAGISSSSSLQLSSTFTFEEMSLWVCSTGIDCSPHAWSFPLPFWSCEISL